MAKQIYGLVGHPVKHSLSPAMHNAAFKELGMDAEYLLYDVEPENLNSFLKDTGSKKIAGLNITIPHKLGAKQYLEINGIMDSNAKKLGAVNTIKIAADGSLCGYNTDGPGLYRALVEDLKFEPEGKNIFVLGAGGASWAIVMYLGNAAKKIFISDVDAKKTDELVKHYRKFYDADKICIIGRTRIEDAIAQCELLINATPVGMREGDPSPIDKKLLRHGQYVYDLVYNRHMTTLLKDAIVSRCHTSTGLGMLLYQGAVAFEIWTGKSAPVAVMRKALKEALKANG